MAVLTLAALHAQLGGELIGDGSVELSGVAALEHAGPGQLSFVCGTQRYWQGCITG